MSDTNNETQQAAAEPHNEGRDDYFMDIDRMINEGLGGGNVTIQGGLIEETTIDTMEPQQGGD